VTRNERCSANVDPTMREHDKDTNEKKIINDKEERKRDYGSERKDQKVKKQGEKGPEIGEITLNKKLVEKGRIPTL